MFLQLLLGNKNKTDKTSLNKLKIVLRVGVRYLQKTNLKCLQHYLNTAHNPNNYCKNLSLEIFMYKTEPRHSA